jgi:hypothetical protein
MTAGREQPNVALYAQRATRELPETRYGLRPAL